MGKTVKSRIFMSITAMVCVAALCIIANSGIPSLYKSYAEKVAAQDAATRPVKQVVTMAPATTTTTTEAVTEGSVDYEIEETTTEAVTEEATQEEVTEEETTTEAEEAPAEESFLDKILNFFTSLFSGELFSSFGDIFSDILGIFGL